MVPKKLLPILLLLLAGFGAASEPVTVPARLVDGIWIVEAKINNKPAFLLVDSGSNRTALLSNPYVPDGDQSVDLAIGSFRTRELSYVTNDSILNRIRERCPAEKDGIKPLVGILGMDVLSRCAIGFDMSAQTISIWADGKVTDADAVKWLSASGSAEPVQRIKIQRKFDVRFGVEMTFGSAKAQCLLDTGSAITTLDPRIGKDLGVALFDESIQAARASLKVSVRGVPNARIGDLDLPWTIFHVSPTTEADSVPDGVVGMGDLRSRRVLIDFPGGQMSLAPEDSDGSLSRALTGLVGSPSLVVKGDSIRVGPAGPDATESEREMQGCQVLSIASRAPKLVLEALRGKGADPFGYLCELSSRTHLRYLMVTQNGALPQGYWIEPKG